METLIYIAIFSILMSGAVVGSYNLLEGGSRNMTATGIQEEGTFLNRKINWALTGATATAASPSGTTLTITRPDLGSQSPLVITSNGTSMTITRGVSTPVVLNSDRFPVSGPSSGYMFSIQPAVAGRPSSATVSFQILGRPFLFRTYVRQ